MLVALAYAEAVIRTPHGLTGESNTFRAGPAGFEERRPFPFLLRRSFAPVREGIAHLQSSCGMRRTAVASSEIRPEKRTLPPTDEPSEARMRHHVPESVSLISTVTEPFQERAETVRPDLAVPQRVAAPLLPLRFP